MKKHRKGVKTQRHKGREWETRGQLFNPTVKSKRTDITVTFPRITLLCVCLTFSRFSHFSEHYFYTPFYRGVGCLDMPQFLPLGANSTASVCSGGGQRIGFYPPLCSPLQQPVWSPVCVAFNPSVTAAALIHLHGVQPCVYMDYDSTRGNFVLGLIH